MTLFSPSSESPRANSRANVAFGLLGPIDALGVVEEYLLPGLGCVFARARMRERASLRLRQDHLPLALLACAEVAGIPLLRLYCKLHLPREATPAKCDMGSHRGSRRTDGLPGRQAHALYPVRLFLLPRMQRVEPEPTRT